MKGGSGEEQATKRPKHEQDIPPLRLEVFDHMRFIKDHVVPGFALEDVGVTTGKCVRCDADVKVMLVIPPLPEFLPPLCRPVVAKRLKPWQKLLEFHLPIQEYTSRYNLLTCMRILARTLQISDTHDQMRTPNASVTCKMS